MIAVTRAFFVRHPLFASAVTMVAAVCVVELSGSLFPWGILAVFLAFIIAGWRRGAILSIAALLAGAGLQHRHALREDLAGRLTTIPAGETLEIKMLADARQGRSTWTGPARVVSGNGEAAALVGHRIWVIGSGDSPPVAGTRLLAPGDFLPPRTARNPGNFDEAAWLRREGMAGVFRIQRRGGESHTSDFAHWRAGVRKAFRNSITAGLDEDSQAAKVLRAVVMGEHPRDSIELVDAFRHSGTLHVFCVSGLHVGMVGFLGWAVLGFAGVPRRWAVAAIIPLMFGYTWLTGSGAPAVRASCMAAVFLTAFVIQRKPDALNALGAVLSIMLLWDGRMLFQPGVQLSYGVVVAIIVGATLAARMFHWVGRKDAFLPQDEYGRIRKSWFWLRKHTAQSLAVSSAAWVGSTPLTAYHFGLITPASIPATVVQIPIVFCLLAIALVSSMIHPFVPAVSRGINQGNALLANACVGVARGFASIPGGSIRMARDSGSQLIIYDLPYGDGAAVFIPQGNAAVMIDCGSARTFRSQVLSSLRRAGIRPESVILTYPGGGHAGGGAQVWESLPIRQALLPVSDARSPAYRDWLHVAPAAGVKTGFAKSGDRFQVGPDAWIEILNEPSRVSPRARAIERVMILRLHWAGWRILFTSDAGITTERALLESGIDCSADVIIAGRNPGDLTPGDDFLDAVSPQVIIASNVDFPAEQKLDPQRIEYWRSIGIRVLDQKDTGAVTLRVDPDGSLRMDAFVSGESISLPPRE